MERWPQTPVPIVDAIEADGARIVVHPRPEALGSYLREPFWVEYDEGVDVASWPLAWQLAPFVLNVAPVAWATGHHVTVDVLDEPLTASLYELQRLFREELYAALPWSGSLTPERVVPARASPDTSGPIGVLFSGGLDSVATVFRHLDRPQTLVTVWGADVDVSSEEGWSIVRGHAEAFGTVYGQRVRVIRSNFRSFLDGWQLDRLHPSVPDWWGHVQHGMGFIGLAAPMLLASGTARLHIASTHTPTFAAPWGSSPKLDESVQLGALTVVHDAYDLSRQAKIRMVKELALAHAVPFPPLRVCYANPSGDGSNCGRCEKCLRTIVGLLLEGIDPASSDFDEAPQVSLARVRRKFARHVMPSSANAAWMWGELQARARALAAAGTVDDTIAGWRPFVAWLERFDFDAYARRYGRVRAVRRRVQELLRRSPRLTALARRAAIRIEER